MYSKEQKDMALQIYHQTRSVTKTIRILGYPTRRNLYTWILEENAPPVYSRKPHMIGLERQINGEKTLKRNTVLQYLRCNLFGMDVQKKYSAVKKNVQLLSHIRKRQ